MAGSNFVFFVVAKKHFSQPDISSYKYKQKNTNFFNIGSVVDEIHEGYQGFSRGQGHGQPRKIDFLQKFTALLKIYLNIIKGNVNMFQSSQKEFAKNDQILANVLKNVKKCNKKDKNKKNLKKPKQCKNNKKFTFII